MKSKVITLPPNDVFISDVDMFRAQFDHEELATAVERNEVRSLVYAMLLPGFGASPALTHLVDNVVSAVMAALARLVRERSLGTVGGGVVVLFRGDNVKTVEDAFRKVADRTKLYHDYYHYWVGENREIK